MKQEVKIGQQDYTVLILVRDSTTGAPKTALTFESAGIDVCYVRVETDNDVVLTDGAPVTTTLTGDHVDWGFVKVDDTKAPGLYKLDIADGVFATGAWSAVVSFICTGCDPVHLEFVLVPETPYDGVKIKSIADNAITANAINADAITSAKIADNAFANEHFADGALTSTEITSAGGCVVASIANNAITAAAIANGAIDNATFAADVGSTAYATNIIALAVRKVLDELNLDHLLKVDTTVAADGDLTSYVADGSVMSHIMTAGADTSDYLASTDSLETAGTNGAAIKAKTDDLAFTTIGVNKRVNAVVKAIVTTELAGDGSATPWGPA